MNNKTQNEYHPILVVPYFNGLLVKIGNRQAFMEMSKKYYMEFALEVMEKASKQVLLKGKEYDESV